jgi:hypothetical protein
MATRVHRQLEVVAFNANGTGTLFPDLHIDVDKIGMICFAKPGLA